MTIDARLKPEGAPERSPIAGAGAPSGVDAGPKRYSVQRKMAVVARSHGDVRVKSQIQWRIGKTPEAVRYPRFEPASVTWSFPHQIKLTFGRRAKRLHQYPACGGWGSGGRDHSCCRLFKPYAPSIRPPRSAETDRVSVDCVDLLRSSMRRPSLRRLR